MLLKDEEQNQLFSKFLTKILKISLCINKEEKSMSNFKYINESFYNNIKEVLEQARKRIYRNIQREMVRAYWQIGKMIVEKQGGKGHAKYGMGLIKELSNKLTNDFGKGFDERALRLMRQFYCLFPIWDSVSPELSWSNYKLILSLDDEKARNFYITETIECH